MNRDPYYELILRKLGDLHDGDLFEQCACDLLREDHPTLIPVPGGNDAGLDGAWAEEGELGLLIATVSPDVIGNVTTNLDAQRKAGGRRRRVLIATSQALTPLQCRNLEERVTEKGYRLANAPYTRNAIAEKLYHNSRWCSELLGLSGRACALSRVPKGFRPVRDLPLIGREEDLKWILSTKGDRLIVGQPGIGKTYLETAAAQQGQALFVVDSEPNRLADAIRDQRPTALVIEDAHFQMALLEELLHLRIETRADFDIIADSWPGDAPRIQEMLALSGEKCRELLRLNPEQIVELVKAAGIIGPEELLHQFIWQCVGCPGRAATLVHLCKAGDVEKVWKGEALVEWAAARFPRLVGEQAMQLLAAFSIGGSAGMAMADVAQLLGYPLGDVQLRVSRLAAAGVVEVVSTGVLQVLPEPLRCVLVRDLYVNSPVPLPLAESLQHVPHLGRAVCTLTGAYARGARIGSEYLLGLVEEAKHAEAWDYFTACDPKHAHLVLDKHPDRLSELAKPLLRGAPQRVIPLLLREAVGDNRELHSTLNHPLRIIGDWVAEAVPGTGSAIERRRLLIDAATQWLVSGADQEVGLTALSAGLSISFQDNREVPGKADTFTFRMGVLTTEEASELFKEWPRVRSILGRLQIAQWHVLLRTVDEWLHGGRHPVSPDSQHQAILDAAASTMLVDIAKLAKDRPGVLSSLLKKAQHLDLKVECDIDSDYAVLFPPKELAPGFEKAMAEQKTAADALADRLSQSTPAHVAEKLAWCVRESAAAGRPWPDWTGPVCHRIAAAPGLALDWFDALCTVGLGVDHARPFLEIAIERNQEGWESRARHCLDSETLVAAAVPVLLTHRLTSQALLGEAIQKSDLVAGTIQYLCIAGQVPTDRVKMLVESGLPLVSEAACIGVWEHEPKGNVPDEMKPSWQTAVIAHVHDEYHLCEMLEGNRDLAFAWLLDRAQHEAQSYRHEDDAISAACGALDEQQKRTLLLEVKTSYQGRQIARALVGDDEARFKELLERNLDDYT